MRYRALVVCIVSSLIAGTSAAAVDGVRVIEDVDYVEGADYADGKDRLDLYLPEGSENFPVLVFFHGGGLIRGDKSVAEHVGTSFASEGIGVAVANYRLSPTVEHPAHAEDAARAIAWVHSNIEDHGGNPDELFISGHSAGAYLAALLALDSSYLMGEGLTTDVLAGSIPISGFFYVDEVAPDRPKHVWGENESVWKKASPSRYVRADAPPLLFLYADGDDPWRREQNERIVSELTTKGSQDAEAVEIANRDHGGIFRSIGAADPTFKAMVAFMEAH